MQGRRERAGVLRGGISRDMFRLQSPHTAAVIVFVRAFDVNIHMRPIAHRGAASRCSSSSLAGTDLAFSLRLHGTTLVEIARGTSNLRRVAAGSCWLYVVYGS